MPYARLVAPYLGKYIPGSPTVVVENRLGAGQAPSIADTLAASVDSSLESISKSASCTSWPLTGLV